MTKPVSTRLVRLLNMVPYFQAHPRVGHDQAAADLGVSRTQLERDLNQLFVCGLPGGYGGDLIDIEFDGPFIQVIFSAGVDQPLRLTSLEATGVLMALRALTDVPGVVNPEATRSAIAKIESAAGSALSQGQSDSSAIGSGVAEAVETPAVAAVREAVASGRSLQLEYYSASRDTQSTRIVDPIRIVWISGHSYLEAQCRDAEAVRLFRFDRIIDAVMLDEPAAPPETHGPTDTSLFDADPALPSATLRVTPEAAWMLDYYPMRVLADLPDGSFEASMTYASAEWMTRLVLGFGAEVTVLSPPELAEQVSAQASAALAAYSTATEGN